MAWKINLVTAALSVMILNPLDAARGVERTLKSPQTVKDTSSMLQEMHGQMRVMQEQLGSLKASQQLLSAENAIKNLTPKVRKLEIHLERLEKQFAQGASTDELNSLRSEFSDMKDKLHGLISAPDTSVDAALSALHPTLDRMQKQVYYLYEAVKKQSDSHEKELNEKMSLVARKMAEFEQDIQTKLADMQGTASSLTLIRQALQHNHSLITTLKVDIESIKNEKIGQLAQDIQNVKHEFSKEELVSKVATLKSHVTKLATVFKKSLSSLQTTTQMAEKSLAQSNVVDTKVKDLYEAQAKQLNGLKALYQKNQAVIQQLDLVKAVVEQSEQGLVEKVKNELKGYKLEAVQKGLVYLKNNQDNLLGEISQLKKNNETFYLEQQAHLDDIKAKANKFQDYDDKLSNLDKKSMALFHHVKNLASRSEIDKLAQGLGLSLDKIDSLYQDMKHVHDEIEQSLAKNDRIEKEMVKINESYSHFEGMQQKLEKLSMQCVYLHKQMKSISPAQDLQVFKDQIADLSTKVNALLEQKPQDFFEKVSTHIQSKFEAMQNEINSLSQKLEEKDSQISKLTRRVAFLTKTLSEKLEQNPQDSLDLNQFKASLEEKMEKEIKAVQSDRMLFETLIQRVAALEASINVEESMLKETPSDRLDP
jgi:chromosome segregation ATPase